MNKLALAIHIAAEAFKDKVDKAGKPYILHCLRVMNNVDQNDDELMQIAVLHDIIEDTDYTSNKLRKLNFSDRVIDALILLTHDKNESYDDYIRFLSINQDATKVKLADLIDNSNITRLKGLRKKDFLRMEKYHKAFIYLSN